MSLPLGQQPPPAYEEPSGSHGGGGGSVGPVIGVLVAIAVLGVIAGVVGWLCSGRSILGYGRYDLHGWIERKCASCVDGRLETPPPPPPPQPQPNANGASSAGPAAVMAGEAQEAKPGPARRREISEAAAESHHEDSV